jgi:TPR repeat protein
MYLQGQGVSQSNEYAYAWWLVATANGNEFSRHKRVAVQEQMTPGQIEKAQRLAIEILLKLGD